MKARGLCLLAPALAMAACGTQGSNKFVSSTTPSSSTNPTTTTSMTVSSPASGAQLTSPFTVTAAGTMCFGEPISSMGYSLDDSSTTTVVNGAAIHAQVAGAAGAHTLHVKAWGSGGAACDTDVAIMVNDATTPPSSPAPPSASPLPSPVPDSAIAVNGIQALAGWLGDHDTESGNGTSTGATSLTSSPSQSGTARAFTTAFTNHGGERYHVAFGSDPASTNFLYDAWFYLASPSDSIANLEMDMNQVMSNGETVIYGFQCDGYYGTWDYTENAGTPENPNGEWQHSKATCNPREWSTDTWHHVQITYSRDSSGNVTYKSVWLDDAEQDINETAPASFALGWGPVLLTNFQVDGLGASGTNTVYIDNMTIYRW